MAAHDLERRPTWSVIRQTADNELVSLQTRILAAACRGNERAQRITDASDGALAGTAVPLSVGTAR